MKQAVKIFLVYIIFCGLYIVLSDYLVNQHFDDDSKLTYIQTIKGLVFVFFSGLLIFWLYRNSLRKLEELSKHYKIIFDESPLPAMIIDFETLKYLKINRAAEFVFKRTEAEYLKAKPGEFVTNYALEELVKIRDEFNEKGYVELLLDELDGEQNVVNTQIFARKIEYNNKPAICLISLDITSIKDDGINLIDKMIDILDGEKKRISGEIHDGIKQYFAMISGMLRTYQKRKEMKFVMRALEMSEEGLKESRRLSHSIALSEMDNDSVVDTWNYFIENLNYLYETEYQLNIDIKNNYKPETYRNLFRILQESTSNIEQHARAKSVSIRLFESKQFLELDIRDDGVGFESTSHNRLRNIGLNTMRTRVTKLGGAFSIISRIGKGTHINAKIPIKKNLEHALA